jgi:hypothetical protein
VLPLRLVRRYRADVLNRFLPFGPSLDSLWERLDRLASMKLAFLLLFNVVVASNALLAKDPSPFPGTWTGVETPGRYIVIVFGKSEFRCIELITDPKPNNTNLAFPLTTTWRGTYTVHDSIIVMKSSIPGYKTSQQRLQWSVNQGPLILQSDDGKTSWVLTRPTPGRYLD